MHGRLICYLTQGVDLYTNIEWIYTESHEDQIKVRESLPFVRVLSNYLFFLILLIQRKH